MTFVVDLSYGWPVCTGAELVRIGATGVIGYTGCNDVAKNVDKATFQGWLDAGLAVALVIENGAQDMLGGGKAGATLGQNWLRGAEALGYDVEHCIGYTSADWHVQPNQMDAVQDAFYAFCSYLEYGGLYAPGPALEYVHSSLDYLGHGLWNSNSLSFGPVSVHANLIQRYGDPRAQGLPVDINDVGITPLYFMGGDVAGTIGSAPIPATVYGMPAGTDPIQWLFDMRGAVADGLAAIDAKLDTIIAALGSQGSAAGNYTASGTITLTKEA